MIKSIRSSIRTTIRKDLYSNIDYYLNKTLRPCYFAIPIKTFETTKEKLLTNELFEVQKDNTNIIIKDKIKLENIELNKYLNPTSNVLKPYKCDKNYYYYETKNQIPIRWIYMIRNFYYPDIVIKKANYYVNYIDILNSKENEYYNELFLDQIFNKEYKNYYFNIDDKRWNIANITFIKKILDLSKNYKSLNKQTQNQINNNKPILDINKKNLKIMFNNSYYYDYYLFKKYNNYLVNETNNYFLNNYICDKIYDPNKKILCVEEQVCLKLFLEKHNINVSELKF